MAKKISIEMKRRWLEKYEKGVTVQSLAKGNNCDTRTVQKALNDARRERDARYARSELMKEALHNHQDMLKNELNNILKSLEIPRVDYVPLSWSQGDNSIFSPPIENSGSKYILGIARFPGKPREAITSVTELLRQHLKNEKAWKLLTQCDKTHAEHLADREAFQRQVKYTLETITGHDFSDKDIKPERFLYSYVIGPSVYSSILGVFLEGRSKDQFESDIKIDIKSGSVKYQGSTMAEVRGNEEKCRKNIIIGLEELLESEELKKVQTSSALLKQIYNKSKQLVDEVLMLGYIPGSCRVCQRLGM